MKLLRSGITFCFIALAALAFSVNAAPLPADWQHQQEFDVSAAGLMKFSLPVETLDAARSGLSDLRVYDDASNEIPYLIEHPVAARRVIRNAKSFQTTLSSQDTVITLETGLAQAMDGVALQTPANNFIKAVQIEGSNDGRRWQEIARGEPIFRQPNGVNQLQIETPPGFWAWLRLTIDDGRSQPIPFTGALVQAASAESAPDEPSPVSIVERHESPGETRLTLNLGAANLELSKIQIETAEPLFTRQVMLATPDISEDSITERPLTGGVIYRVAVDGLPASSGLSVPVEAQVRSRELLMLIRNNDSPPLPVTAVLAERRPVYIVFLAKQTGAHYLVTGNPRCPAPRYDLAELSANLKTVAAVPMKVSSIADNPAYRLPEVLPDLQTGGVALDVSAWRYRKPVTITRAGGQQLELDLDVLSSAQPGFEDLRLMRDGKQVPYIIERTSIQRVLNPIVTKTNDAHDPKISRWIVKLPRSSLPVIRLMCAAQTPLFQREITAYENVRDDRGETFRRSLGSASWTQRPGASHKEFGLTLSSPPQSDAVFLETENGDNPSIELTNFQFFYPATRVLFKADADDALFLYYGNPNTEPPRYDLSLVANQLLAADKNPVSGGMEEQLRKTSTRGERVAGGGSVMFWSILVLVAVVLLAIISKLLPKTEAQPPK